MKFDPQQFKARFPLFAQPQNRELVYLDNAATTQRPQVVIDAISAFYLHSNANTHRSSHRLARQATAMLERVRAQAAAFFGLDAAAGVVFCHGATAGLNLLAHSLTRELPPGAEIILSEAEHHANLVPWQRVAQERQLQLRFVPAAAINAASLQALLSENTRIVALTAASNALGTRSDLAAVAALLRDRNIRWVVDGSQLAAHARVNVQVLGCDFFVCAPHKFYGPTGVGLVLGQPRRWAELPPWQSGGDMIDSVTLTHATYAEPPHRFETGTPPLAAIAGLGALFDWLAGQDRDAMQAHEQDLLVYAHQQLGALAGLELLTVPARNVGIIALVPAPATGWSAADLGVWLDEQDIAVRVGQHCAMPLMAQLGAAASLRVSLAAYNTRADIDRLVTALRTALQQRWEVPVASAAKDDLSGCSLARLEALGSWQARYKQIMHWAGCIQPKPALRTEANRVSGCEAAAWLGHCCINGRHWFTLDSEARVVRGLAVVLLLLIDGRTTAELQALDVEATFAGLGLERHLSPSRRHGLRALLTRALACAGLPRGGASV